LSISFRNGGSGGTNGICASLFGKREQIAGGNKKIEKTRNDPKGTVNLFSCSSLVLFGSFVTKRSISIIEQQLVSLECTKIRLREVYQ